MEGFHKFGLIYEIDVWPSLYRWTNFSCLIASSLCMTGIHGLILSFHPWDPSTCPMVYHNDLGRLADAHMNVSMQDNALQESAQDFSITLHHTWKTTESLIGHHASNSSLLPVEFD